MFLLDGADSREAFGELKLHLVPELHRFNEERWLTG